MFVRHGAVFVRVSPNRLQKVKSYVTDEVRISEHSIEDRSDEKEDEKEETEPRTILKELRVAGLNKETTHRLYNRTEDL